MEIENKQTKSNVRYPYLVRFRSTHNEFRIPELLSLAKLFDADIKFDEEQAKIVSSQDSKIDSPFLEANFRSIEHVKKIAERTVTINNFFEYFESASSIQELAKKVIANEKSYERFFDGKSFKFYFDSYGKKVQMSEQKEMLVHFKDFPLWDRCPLSLDKPERIFYIFIDYGRDEAKDIPKKFYFGLKIADGNIDLIDKFNVKKRKYIGTTSMDSELSLIIANMALASPGKLILDPFAGTGSLLLTCSQFGAMTMGCDIDPRVIRGNTKATIHSNFTQHNLQGRLLDLIIADQAHPGWRATKWFDSIVADPPYGIRAGARKVGKKVKTAQKELLKPKNKEEQMENPHISQCVPYELQELLLDLLNFAAKSIALGGRVVYWFPTTDQYKDSDIPLHPCFVLIANSEQPLSGELRRRLITMEKIKEP